MTKLDGKTLDIEEQNIKKIKELFPEINTDGKIDFEKLKQLLGDYVDDSEERYKFTWNGKGEALRISQTQSMGTLRPAPEEGESKNWDNTGNLYIEGDNLEVLKLLQKSYFGKIKMIYIDPPYNTGKDFVYKDNYKDNIKNYKKITGQVDNNGNMNTTNPEYSGRYHTDWLNMMYPRLRLARNLIKDDGVIFISIDENEVHNIRKICDEIFGEDNFIGKITVETANGVFGTRASGLNSKLIKVKDYVVAYAKSKKEKNFVPLYMPTNERFDTHYSIMLDENLKRSSFTDYIRESNELRCFFEKYKMNISLDNVSKIMNIDKEFNNIIINKISNRIYQDVAFSLKVPIEIENKLKTGNIIKWKDYLIFKTNNGTGTIRQLISFKDSLRNTDDYISEYRRAVAIGDLWEGFDNDMKNVSNEGISCFDSPKPVRLIKQLIKWCNVSTDNIILDFFAGSSTTAHAVMDLNGNDGKNRKFIMVQLPELVDKNSEAYKKGYKNIAEIGKERIRLAGDKIKSKLEEKYKKANENEKKDMKNPEELDIGFKVFKLDSSNIREWNPGNYDNIQLAIEDSQNPYVNGRSEEDVVYEMILKMGLDLTYPVEKHEIADKVIYSIGYGLLMICLSDNIDLSIAKKMIEIKNNYNQDEFRAIFRDGGFNSDKDKTNIKETLKSEGLAEESFITL